MAFKFTQKPLYRLCLLVWCLLLSVLVSPTVSASVVTLSKYDICERFRTHREAVAVIGPYEGGLLLLDTGGHLMVADYSSENGTLKQRDAEEKTMLRDLVRLPVPDLTNGAFILRLKQQSFLGTLALTTSIVTISMTPLGASSVATPDRSHLVWNTDRLILSGEEPALVMDKSCDEKKSICERGSLKVDGKELKFDGTSGECSKRCLVNVTRMPISGVLLENHKTLLYILANGDVWMLPDTPANNETTLVKGNLEKMLICAVRPPGFWEKLLEGLSRISTVAGIILVALCVCYGLYYCYCRHPRLPSRANLRLARLRAARETESSSSPEIEVEDGRRGWRRKAAKLAKRVKRVARGKLRKKKKKKRKMQSSPTSTPTADRRPRRSTVSRASRVRSKKTVVRRRRRSKGGLVTFDEGTPPMSERKSTFFSRHVKSLIGGGGRPGANRALPLPVPGVLDFLNPKAGSKAPAEVQSAIRLEEFHDPMEFKSGVGGRRIPLEDDFEEVPSLASEEDPMKTREYGGPKDNGNARCVIQ